MMNRKGFKIGFCLIIILGNSVKAQIKTQDKINWKKFFQDKDLVFDSLPSKWEDAPYFGNGFIGSMIYRDNLDKHTLKIQLFRTDVQDHRGDSSGWTPYSRPRLQIGYLNITFKGKILGGNLRQHLFTANLTGRLETTLGEVSIHHFVQANKDLILTEINCRGREGYKLGFQPAEAKSTRRFLFPDNKANIQKFAELYGNKYNDILKIYQPNPKPQKKKIGGLNLNIQNLLSGGQYVVAWRKDVVSKSKSRFAVTIQNSYPEFNAEKTALQQVADFHSGDFSKAYKNHTKWWYAFYQKSFMSIPDKGLEKMYWLQLYKVGSAARPNGPIMDTSGPWFQETPWPYITWDLNVQLCYWLLNTSNHLDLAMSLPNALNRNKQQLINNVQPADWRKDAAYLALATAQDLKGAADDDKRYQNLHANLLWAMHNVWLIYRYSMNENFLRTQCYPLLKRSIGYYLHLLKKDNDGRYHIPLGYSPEYPIANKAAAGETKDPNIDIALLKWGLKSLLKSSIILQTDIDLRSRWKNVLENLVDFQADKNGLMIGADIPYTVSHRHYSHLLMIYPLYLLNIDSAADLPLIKQSLKYWIQNFGGLQGYSYTGASSISSAIGDGDQALHYLKGLSRFILPNGLYKEKGPCLETPLSAAQSIQDMLLQSWGDKIRIFPAVPSSWKNITFHHWLAEGAFDVSATLKDRKVVFIAIKSLAGSPCIFKSDIENPVAFLGGKKTRLKLTAEKTYQVNLKQDECVVIKNEE